ncbi:hypothetical protein ACFSM5_05215 [Lacibacterium aquatile]|uniref:Secreted protein n=1 Tax=Lacibacterium aquatile TaxID=1168082 RepID=A0ABW5DP06_9PROT
MRGLTIALSFAVILTQGFPVVASSIAHTFGPRSPLVTFDRYSHHPIYAFEINTEEENSKVVEAFDAFFASRQLRSEHKSNDDLIDVDIDKNTRISLLAYIYSGEPDKIRYFASMRVKPNPEPFSEPAKQLLRDLRLHMLERFPGTQSKYPVPKVSDFGDIHP